jgi:hypothetical protein
LTLIAKKLSLDQNLVEWVENTFPEASVSGIVNLLLEKFKGAVEHTPTEYAEIAAKQFLEEG